MLHSHAKDPLAAFEHLYATADLPPLMRVCLLGHVDSMTRFITHLTKLIYNGYHPHAATDCCLMLQVGMMEPRMLRHYLLLHNDQEDAEGGLPW